MYSEIQLQAHEDGINKIIVGAFIVRNGRFLIVRRSPSENFMAGFDELPSGHLEPGETIEEALTREIFEETGLRVKEIKRYINSFDYTSTSGERSRQLNFFVRFIGEEITLNPLEHSDYKWLSPQDEEFKHLKLSNETRKCIELAYKQLELQTGSS